MERTTLQHLGKLTEIFEEKYDYDAISDSDESAKNSDAIQTSPPTKRARYPRSTDTHDDFEKSKGEEVVVVEDEMYTEIGNYYFKTEKIHDVHFIVGPEKVRIGAVRQPLINQSRVWWDMLSEDSSYVEITDIHIPDINPDTFTLLLKHCYGGLEDLSSLSSNTLVRLCVCAKTYSMSSLMKKISICFKPLNIDLFFPALYCLVSCNLRSIEEDVKKFIKTKADKIFAHRKFLKCKFKSIEYIIEQESIGCYNEGSIWKAVVSWAKHNAECDEGPVIREFIFKLMRHIRLLTMNYSYLCDDVFSLNVLNGHEIASICKKDVSSLTYLCSNNKEREFYSGTPYCCFTGCNSDYCNN